MRNGDDGIAFERRHRRLQKICGPGDTTSRSFSGSPNVTPCLEQMRMLVAENVTDACHAAQESVQAQ